MYVWMPFYATRWKDTYLWRKYAFWDHKRSDLLFLRPPFCFPSAIQLFFIVSFIMFSTEWAGERRVFRGNRYCWGWQQQWISWWSYISMCFLVDVLVCGNHTSFIVWYPLYLLTKLSRFSQGPIPKWSSRSTLLWFSHSTLCII